jgi:hypothetical protein
MFANVVEKRWFLSTLTNHLFSPFSFHWGILEFQPWADVGDPCLRLFVGPPDLLHAWPTVCNDLALILDLPSKNVVLGISVAHKIVKSVAHCSDSLPI